MPDEDQSSEDMRQAEQAMAWMADMAPPHWRRMYLNLIEAEFTKEEAMDLLKTYILK